MTVTVDVVDTLDNILKGIKTMSTMRQRRIYTAVACPKCRHVILYSMPADWKRLNYEVIRLTCGACNNIIEFEMVLGVNAWLNTMQGSDQLARVVGDLMINQRGPSNVEKRGGDLHDRE
jgi:hypothetical protein